MGATKISCSSNPIGESNTVELTGKIMVVAIIFLFMVVIFVLLLHIYAKWFWWRFEENTAPPPPRSRRRRRRFVFAPGQDPVSYSYHQIGLDPLVLKSLPILDFQLEDFKDGLECAVCLSEIVQDEKIRLLPKCNHGFHVDCIDMWFHSHSTCPLCRNPISSEKIFGNSSISSSNVEENVSNSESFEEESLTLESSNFPTNVLVWGDQSQVSSFGVSLELEEGSSQSQQPLPCSSSSSSSSSNSASDSVDTSTSSRCNGMLVIDIPSEFNSSSLSPSANRCAEDEMKSPMAAKLRSFKRLLSRDKKLISPCSPSSMDVEQGHG